MAELYDASDEMARAALEDVAIVDAAHAYCEALAANAAAEPPDWMTRLAALDAALHDLQLACGYDPCEGECPGFIASAKSEIAEGGGTP